MICHTSVTPQYIKYEKRVYQAPGTGVTSFRKSASSELTAHTLGREQALEELERSEHTSLARANGPRMRLSISSDPCTVRAYAQMSACGPETEALEMLVVNQGKIRY